ncbi:hypothetical protein V6N11_073729 [Hibiscus sabdariffa]|uniref:Reverse transcriptase Ty1/copia-type domain-containing protein n=1 Tax=Hibiscus sabdariffa TaxID=183260 RepID=A0ABR2AEZ7_9ROSI
MRSTIDSMSENQVWTLVEPPDGVKLIGYNWVFKKKTDMDGNVQTYKGRLVSKGFRQIHGVDYDENFSPIAMFKSIRILLAIVAFLYYEIWQMNVKIVFLNGKLEEDLYMTKPEGFVAPTNVGKVCKLQSSIYGVKQASRSWNLRFNDAIKEFGFIKNKDEPCVYKKKSSKQDIVVDSTTEAKNIAAREATKEAIWIKKIISELGVVPSISDVVELHCDNNGVIAQVKEPRSHQRSKHIVIHFHLIREVIDRGDVEICKVHTNDNIVRYVSDWS